MRVPGEGARAAVILEGRGLIQGVVALRSDQGLPENWPETLKDMKCIDLL